MFPSICLRKMIIVTPASTLLNYSKKTFILNKNMNRLICIIKIEKIFVVFSEHFPYYKSNDDRWKNSVRHNLSINPHFRKGSKATHGAGHLWAIANRGDCRPRPLPVTSLTNTTQTQVAQNESEESRSNKIIR